MGTTLHIMMEYCSGGSLQQVMARRERSDERFDEEEIFDWFLQIAMALTFVHQQKVRFLRLTLTMAGPPCGDLRPAARAHAGCAFPRLSF